MIKNPCLRMFSRQAGKRVTGVEKLLMLQQKKKDQKEKYIQEESKSL